MTDYFKFSAGSWLNAVRALTVIACVLFVFAFGITLSNMFGDASSKIQKVAAYLNVLIAPVAGELEKCRF